MQRAFLNYLYFVCFQEFIFCVVPLIFWTGLDASDLPLSYPALHYLLEEFIPPFYYNQAYLALQTFLTHTHKYLDQNSASWFNHNAFIELMLMLIAIPKDMHAQQHFDKWSIQMRTTCHKIPAPVSQVHLSLEFECPTPGIVELLPGKGKFQQSAKSVPAAAASAPDTETALSLPALSSFIMCTQC